MIEGKNIQLRLFELDDAKTLFESMNNPKIAENLEYQRYYSMEEEEEFIRQSWQQAENNMGYFFAIIEKASSEMVGSVTLSQINLVNNSAELGIWIAEEFQGVGFGEEAVRIVLNFGFNELMLNSIKATVIDFNEKSRSLFAKVGMRETGKERESVMRNGAYHDVIWFDMLKKEFRE